jgi:hypothetical protein
MSVARLNVFQRLARAWQAVHPYNAAQVLRIHGRADQAAVGRAWDDTLATHGLGRSAVSGRWCAYESPAHGAISTVNHLPSETLLARHLTDELNRPFESPDGCPFRPFLIEHPHGESYSFGVVYQHWTADSVSVRLLLRDWFSRLDDPPSRATAPFPPTRLSYRDLFGPSHPAWRADTALLALLRRYLAMRRVRKIHTMGPLDYPVRVRLADAGPGLLEPLHQYARRRGVKLNDVFVAALAEACAALVPAQDRPGRHDLAVASVADLRPHAGRHSADLSETFGLFLGFTTSVCRERHLHDWDRLLDSVAAQSRVSRRDGIGPASALWLAAAAVGSRFVPPGRMYDFHRKEIPLAAGISNVNLGGTWVEGRHPAPLVSYLRVSPTGPMVPLVLAVTSLGDRMDLALTYRANLLNAWTASELIAMFVRRLRGLCGG